jgi:hypothetical protein
MIEEFDTVVLLQDLEEHGLEQGDIGAVVHRYHGGETFEVEFVTGGMLIISFTSQWI